jgi:hypothetical protein
MDTSVEKHSWNLVVSACAVEQADVPAWLKCLVGKDSGSASWL